jgi:hypothetical protein
MTVHCRGAARTAPEQVIFDQAEVSHCKGTLHANVFDSSAPRVRAAALVLPLAKPQMRGARTSPLCCTAEVTFGRIEAFTAETSPVLPGGTANVRHRPRRAGTAGWRKTRKRVLRWFRPDRQGSGIPNSDELRQELIIGRRIDASLVHRRCRSGIAMPGAGHRSSWAYTGFKSRLLLFYTPFHTEE